MQETFQPLLEAGPVIQFHVLAASTALVLGPVALYRKRRDRLHKVTGYVWVLAMAITALSSFGIDSFALIGPFRPIHLLALLALWSLFEGMRHIFAGRVRAHQTVLRGLYLNGLLLAGLLNFLPGRVTNRIFFASTPELGYVVIGVGLCAILLGAVRRRRMLKRLSVPAPHAATVARSFQPLAPR